MKEHDNVNRPSHYTQGGIECIDAIRASMSAHQFSGFLKGNVIKYLWRFEHKGKPAEDLKKAAWYLDRLIKHIEGEQAEKTVEKSADGEKVGTNPFPPKEENPKRLEGCVYVTLEHDPPEWCKIRRKFTGGKPSLMFSRCGYGLTPCKHCAGCSENMKEYIEHLTKSMEK